MAYADGYSECEWVEFEILERFMIDVLVREGVPEKDAESIGKDINHRLKETNQVQVLHPDTNRSMTSSSLDNR